MNSRCSLSLETKDGALAKICNRLATTLVSSPITGLPLPDMPRLEPFRHLDPITAVHDRQTRRNPRYWRDLDLEVWQKGEGAELLRSQRQHPWSRRQCKLTPQLGKVDMPTYRQQRPETASVV
jgi:hypothetical protein